MAKGVFSRTVYKKVHDDATQGGTVNATSRAEERMRKRQGLDPLVDPKGLAHLGPIRMSLPRFEKDGDFWVLTNGIPMAEETLLDTTGSMGGNVDLAFDVLPNHYEMLTTGSKPILVRYDPQIATAIFNDIEDNIHGGIPVLGRSQFEMAEKIAIQMTLLPPGRCGCGNGKEDPQFGLFAAAYLTAASINRYGLKYYHFTVSDEPVVETIDLRWLKNIFGEDVLDYVKQNGHEFNAHSLPDTAKTISDLQTRAHAFFLQVPGGQNSKVSRQWTDLYGRDHIVMLPEGTRYLHCVKAVIIGLTEGVLDLQSAVEFLVEHKVPKGVAEQITLAVSHIPLGAQMLSENFSKLPKAGDLFREKTDLWPIDPKEMESAIFDNEGKKESEDRINWL